MNTSATANTSLATPANTQVASDTRWANRRLTVLGLSKTGMATAEYVARHGGQVFMSESLAASPTNEANRQAMQALGTTVEMGGHSKQCFTFATQAVVSPGIPPSNPTLQQLLLSGIEVLSEVELAYRENVACEVEGKRVPLIGVTGTNGKTTTTTLIAEILNMAQHPAVACGNIGYPTLAALDAYPGHALVSEMSSYQLHFSPTLQADIAVFMNLMPDHLQWHGSMDAYARAKMRLFTGAQSPRWAVLNATDALTSQILELSNAQTVGFARSEALVKHWRYALWLDVAGVIQARLPDYTGPVLKAAELQLMGAHNIDNVMAAIATATLMGVTVPQAAQTCLAFTGVPHRLQPVGTLKTPSTTTVFYNDSKATNTDAALSALAAFAPQPIILIAGGYDKMEDLGVFANAVTVGVAHTILIGAARERFAAALREAGYEALTLLEDMPAAVNHAVTLATTVHPNCPVVLSPACASFDQYTNFEARGDHFTQLVQGVVG